MGEAGGKRKGGKLTDGLLGHERSSDGSWVNLVLLVPLGLDLATSAIGEEAGDHLEVGAELTNTLRKMIRGERATLSREGKQHTSKNFSVSSAVHFSVALRLPHDAELTIRS